MAPRTRSNRVEQLARQKLLASGRSFNTHGFPALPDELYLEIISNLPPIPVPTKDVRVNTKALRNRQQTLFSLSQTCRSLRRVFLRYLWQRIEVFDGMETAKGPLPALNTAWVKPRFKNYVYKQYAEELVRQLEIVTVRDPSLAQYVNILNVLVLDYSIDAVFPELLRCMGLFPNLHTVQICFPFPRRHFDPKEILKAYKFPQICNVCVSPDSAYFLSSCPEAKRVSPYLNISFGRCPLLDYIVTYCPKVQTLDSFTFNSESRRRILKYLKDLHDITLDPFSLTDYDNVKDLSQLRLHTIRIRRQIGAGASLVLSYAECVKNAKKVLLACPDTDNKKRVIMYHDNGEVQSFLASET
ncbi:hypothetical protein GALMADRAFT_256541 [Galerina marginata CBS 339.88]|uniref:Uncharacterized protein n=1 Tax=Galerina marginata (strain CBS 339.88) TaxID=685588 RepID=A0A067SPK5_GALM3|nr:hypothetical protein GALMADRAFT_256541 [Galerina marginata CBS 339.88]